MIHFYNQNHTLIGKWQRHALWDIENVYVTFGWLYTYFLGDRRMNLELYTQFLFFVKGKYRLSQRWTTLYGQKNSILKFERYHIILMISRCNRYRVSLVWNVLKLLRFPLQWQHSEHYLPPSPRYPVLPRLWRTRPHTQPIQELQALRRPYQLQYPR